MLKVVLVMNAEVDEAYAIRNTLNNRFTDSFVQYCTSDSLVHEKIIKNLANGGYGAETVAAFKAKDYLAIVKNNMANLDKLVEEAFQDVNEFTYLKFEANTYIDQNLNGTIVLPTVYSGEKPNFDCVYIGWTVPNSSAHLVEHEKFNSEAAMKFQEAYSSMLRRHKDKFDIFFDGDSIENVVEYIRSL